MNLLKKIALVAMTVLMGTGVAIGVGNTLETVVPSDQVAHAANITAGTKLYLDPTFWNPSSARFAAYFFDNNNNNKWASCTLVCDKCNVYSVTAPSGYNWTKVIFCRMNNDNNTNNWDNKWNQTGNLTFDGTNNLFVIKQWDSQIDGWTKFVDTTWTGGMNFEMSLSNRGWKNDNPVFAAYFFGDNGIKWVTGSKLTSSTKPNTYSFTSPVGSWKAVILGRFKPGTTTFGFDPNLWNQSYDICLIHGINKATEASGDDWKKFEYTRNAMFDAETLAFNILNVGEICDQEVYTTECWPNFKNTYKVFLSDTDKNTLKDTVANKTGTTLEHAMARYDLNVKENKAENFIERNIPKSNLGYQVFNTNNDNSNYLLIGLVAISLLIGFVIFFKNKKQRNY